MAEDKETVRKLPEKKDDVLVRVDKHTARRIKRLSRTTQFDIKAMVQWIAWMGTQSMGRKVVIEDGKKVKQIDLTKYPKLSDLK